MVSVVIPFAGRAGKTRLRAPSQPREDLSLAMLDDVVAACEPIGEVHLATGSGGQGAAVAAALAGLPDATVLVVNADLPCATTAALEELLAAAPFDRPAFVAAGDGTTNALRLPSPTTFIPLYGPGSAERYRAALGAIGVDIDALRDDVDTLEDLLRVRERCGPRTRACLAALELEIPA